MGAALLQHKGISEQAADACSDFRVGKPVQNIPCEADFLMGNSSMGRQFPLPEDCSVFWGGWILLSPLPPDSFRNSLGASPSFLRKTAEK